MKKLISFNVCLYLLSFMPFINNEILDSIDSSFLTDFSKHLNNLFPEKNSKVINIRKIRSNSESSYELNGKFETKQSFIESFAEISSLRLKSENKSLVLKQTIDENLQLLPKSVHLFTPNADINRLKTTIESLFASTRHGLTNMSAKIDVQHQIIDIFNANQLFTSTQKFITRPEESTQALEGLNIIGIYPGIYRYSSKDKILLIGAHYDTVDTTGGVNDNGSGMSALLEVIRLINSYNCRLTYSLMFVALDLEEYGALGSKYFVNDYLIPIELIGGKAGFEGAVILDTILNFNQTFGSQDIPYDIHKALPQWSQQIRQNRFVGDFLAVISRNNIDDKIANQFKSYWTSMSRRTPFQLSELKITSLNSEIPDFETLSSHANLLRSDHLMFWYPNNSQYKTSLKAILLSDTGPFRGYMRDCYHISCDNSTHLTQKNLQFLKLTAEVLTQTAVDLTFGTCNQT